MRHPSMRRPPRSTKASRGSKRAPARARRTRFPRFICGSSPRPDSRSARSSSRHSPFPPRRNYASASAGSCAARRRCSIRAPAIIRCSRHSTRDTRRAPMKSARASSARCGTLTTRRSARSTAFAIACCRTARSRAACPSTPSRSKTRARCSAKSRGISGGCAFIPRRRGSARSRCSPG